MGEVFAGRYELIDPIASGGMGTVWRVLDRHDGELKAAKMLRQADAAMLLRFVREQSVRIDHDHVVTPLSWAGVDDRVLFTMPLVRGGSVAGLLKRQGTLSPYWIGQLGDQTLQALAAVHAAGVVHRDIKPGNLLLEPTGTGRPHLRLTDFGIAVPADEPRLTHVAMVIGTPGYMAPEQYRGADPDPRSDVYALGVVLLEMLTGTRPPGDGEPPQIDLSGLRTGDAQRAAVLDLIAAATTYDVTHRPTADELRAHPALAHLLALPADGADGIDIRDEYPPVPEAGTHQPNPSVGRLGTAAYPPPPPPTGATRVDPPPPPPGRTRVDAHALAVGATALDPAGGHAGLAGARGSEARRTGTASGVALLVIGLIGLVVSALLLVL